MQKTNVSVVPLVFVVDDQGLVRVAAPMPLSQEEQERQALLLKQRVAASGFVESEPASKQVKA